MWGRAGRRQTGLELYVAGEDALDQLRPRCDVHELDLRCRQSVFCEFSGDLYTQLMKESETYIEEARLFPYTTLFRSPPRSGSSVPCYTPCRLSLRSDNRQGV